MFFTYVWEFRWRDDLNLLVLVYSCKWVSRPSSNAQVRICPLQFYRDSKNKIFLNYRLELSVGKKFESIWHLFCYHRKWISGESDLHVHRVPKVEQKPLSSGTLYIRQAKQRMIKFESITSLSSVLSWIYLRIHTYHIANNDYCKLTHV